MIESKDFAIKEILVQEEGRLRTKYSKLVIETINALSFL